MYTGMFVSVPVICLRPGYRDTMAGTLILGVLYWLSVLSCLCIPEAGAATQSRTFTIFPPIHFPFNFSLPPGFTFVPVQLPTKPPRLTTHTLPHVHHPPDCRKLHGGSALVARSGSPLRTDAVSELGRRFLVNFDFTNLGHLVEKTVLGNISLTLPVSAEVDHLCRFDMKDATTSELELLNKLDDNGYKICSMCDGFDKGDGTCTTVGVCKPGSVCSRGHNIGYKSSVTGFATFLQPAAVSHGCCVLHTHGCLTHTYVVSDHNKIAKANYSMSVCSSDLCNTDHGLSHDKTKVLHYLLKRDGHWGSWHPWGRCSVTCSHGTRHRSRTCSNPAPFYGGASCAGSSTVSQSCNSAYCPVAGGWSSWGHWSSCSGTCGTGERKRSRTCTHPLPSHGGASCTGNSVDTTSCTTHPCPVNGAWGPWSPYNSCSVTCGSGNRARTRLCNNPLPQNHGHTCAGSSRESVKCSGTPCPVGGHWTSWHTWSHCSVTCEGGVRTRSRSCANPAPAHGGSSCYGSSQDSGVCSASACPVDGGWGSWANRTCSTTCGSGTIIGTRTCDHPTPQHGGHACAGSATKTDSCILATCPVHGKWGAWSSYSGCNVSCGTGSRTRHRPCDSPAPSHGGLHCVGAGRDTIACEQQHCAVNGHWTGWTDWSQCSVTCSSGTQTRSRSCSNPAPAYGGTNCTGNKSETNTCDLGKCPGWSSWFHTDCSVTCGNGTRSKIRHCESGHDEDCPGAAFGSEPCHEKPCPVDGQWGDWQPWGTCSATCAGGTHIRLRNCDSPVPAHGGVTCTAGLHEQESACNTQSCPVWGKWVPLGPCSVTCGEGSQQLKRTCSSGKDADCPGSPFDEQACSSPKC